jgi:hypothetical protein
MPDVHDLMTDATLFASYVSAEATRQLNERESGKPTGEESPARFLEILEEKGDTQSAIDAYAAVIAPAPKSGGNDGGGDVLFDPFVPGALDNPPDALLLAATTDEDRMLARIERNEFKDWREKALAKRNWEEMHAQGNERRAAEAEERELLADPVKMAAAMRQKQGEDLSTTWHQLSRSERLQRAASIGMTEIHGRSVGVADTAGLTKAQADELADIARSSRLAGGHRDTGKSVRIGPLGEGADVVVDPTE